MDSVTKKFIPILGGLNEHPIDILEKKVTQDQDTIGIVERLNGVSKLWNHEIERLLKLINKNETDQKFTDDELNKFKRAQQKWEEYRDAQEKAVVTYFAKRNGTYYFVKAASMILEINKSRASFLWGFLNF